MTQQHVHHYLIIQWAKGAKIQYSVPGFDWTDVGEPSWLPKYNYRIKPEVKPDLVRYYKVIPGITVNQYKPSKESNLNLTFDANTGKLKSAEVIEIK